MSASRQTTVQGKPVVRRGRKARDLGPIETARPPAGGADPTGGRHSEGEPGALHHGGGAPRVGRHGPRGWDPVGVMRTVKPHLYRLILVLSALASSGLVLEAGKRWS